MGPLTGVKVLEIKGIGPGPYAGMLLADMGADVIVVERSTEHQGIGLPAELDIHSRGKRSIVLDLKSENGISTLLKLVEKSDVLFEGFRPGVAERLGFGPEVCHAHNPKLIYGRITGWGQTGPLAKSAGHDINYISLSGALAAIGTKEEPVVPLNLLGDYAGGSHFLVMGILAALFEVRTSGKGQVIDAAINEGVANLMSLFNSIDAAGQWKNQRASNFLDGGAHFYSVYKTSDDKFVSVGAIEPGFYNLLLEKLDLDKREFSEQQNTERWPEYKQKFQTVFETKTHKEWCDLLEGIDVCFAPVLELQEASEHPHNIERESYIEINGMKQPAPAPRFSNELDKKISAPHKAGADNEEILKEFGIKF